MTLLQRNVILFLASVTGLSSYAGAKIEWSNLRHDFGAFDESMGIATAEFTYTNTGDEPLVITGARANCGCTTPVYSTDIVQPGDSGTLTVSYDAGGRPGRFEKKVYVDANTEPSRSVLTIAGVVIGTPSTIGGRYPVSVGPLRLAHSAALLGTVKSGQLKSTFESGYNASADTLSPMVENLPKWLSVNPVPERVSPGEQVSFSFLVNSNKISDWDIVTDTITIRPFEGSQDVFKMPVVVTVNEDFSDLTDKELANAPVVAVEVSTQTNPVAGGRSYDITVSNTGKDPLVLHKLYTRTEGVTTNLKTEQKVKGGKSIRVNVFVPDEAAQSNPVVIFNMITNDPLNPRSTIKIPVVRD